MSMAVSNSKGENDISFGSSIIGISSGWRVIEGSISISDDITMGAESQCNISVSSALGSNTKCDYIKLQCHLTSDDTELSTDNFSAVSMTYIINYTNSSGNNQKIVDIYFPKYDFEDTYKNDYTIISVPNSTINSIEIALINKEDVTVNITNVGLYLSKLIDEESITTIVTDIISEPVSETGEYNEMQEAIQDVVNESLNDGSIAYTVPEMTLEEFMACDHSKINECIIVE